MSPTEFMSAYEAATNAHDLDALLGLIADDAIYLFSNQTAHTGKSAICDAIRANFEAIKGETYRIQNLKCGSRIPMMLQPVCISSTGRGR